METIKNNAMKLVAMILPVFMAVFAFAQNKTAEVDINVGGGEAAWYANPVVWVIGAAVFILLLVALLRGKSND